ncbi:VOC family protein [Rhizobium leguminosarum]|uniref:Glyoxalase family protein n=1 Tax=Rhizobium leguminosarum TaxID=384 RepID=A0A2K9YY32_RHILE|nr:VOC family protein [Rhizobium leguminosarum]AUW40889.1 Glyoxalase family protein [Rhizobium leguminosarum]
MPAELALQFDHCGIVVSDIEQGLWSLAKILPIVGKTERFDDAGLGVSVQFLQDASGMVFELIAPLGDKSPVKKIAATKVGVLNQIAYRVRSLEAGAHHFRAQQALPVGTAKPAIAFGGALVQFFYLPAGLVVELIEAETFSHHFNVL